MTARVTPPKPGQPADSPADSLTDSPADSLTDDPTADPTADPAEGSEPDRVLVPLTTPAGGVPDVVADERRLMAAAAAIGAGTGPVAIDAERASGHRYGQRAYLVQIRREGAGTWLLDPVACPDLSPVAEAIADAEWVLHAATQDLVCLAEVGLRPRALFDTELAARLAGLPRVGLGAAIEHYLGFSLAKEHSAVDWSRRPLPLPWLQYAALDVEVLVELRDAVAADLADQDKSQWAQEEFAALLDFAGPPPRIDPWRRTSGIHRIRRRRGLALLRELWLTRDRIAQRRDISPGRVLPDSVLVELAADPPKDLPEFSVRRSLRPAARNPRAWMESIDRAMAIAEDRLPPLALPGSGPPPPRAWAERDPVAAARLGEVRAGLTAYATERVVPLENLLNPDLLRRTLWTPPDEPTETAFATALTAGGARPWQVSIAAPLLAAAAAQHS